MTAPTRRTVLATGGSALACGAAPARSDPDAAATLAALLREDAGPARIGPWRLADESSEGAEARRLAPAALLDRFRTLAGARLSGVDALDRDTVVAHLTLEARMAREFPIGAAPGRPYVVEPHSGTHRLASAGLGGPAPTPETDEAYRWALARLARNVDGETERLRADAAGFGVVLPRAPLEHTAAAVRAAAATPGDASPLARRAVDRTRAAAVVDGALRPSLARQADALEALGTQAGAGLGVGRFRDGAAYHVLCLRLGTGADLTPDAAEARAHEAAARLTAELDGRLRAEGLTQGGVGERLRALMADPSGLHPDSDSGRDRAVADMNAVVAEGLARRDRLFLDPQPGPVRVARMSPADEAAGRAGYREASNGGGVYYVDLHAIRSRPAWTLPTVAVHETSPGHLLQLAVEAQVRPPPLRVRCAPGYFEGWAVYTETLGVELGLYDRRARIGHLQSLLFRLSRVLADAGVHRRGWSAERTRAELAVLYGGALFNSLDAEVERLVLQPGAGGGDALGWLEIARLRRARAGDPRAFHHAVLARGPYPPRLLARAVALG